MKVYWTSKCGSWRIVSGAYGQPILEEDRPSYMLYGEWVPCWYEVYPVDKAVRAMMFSLVEKSQEDLEPKPDPG